MRKDMLVPQFAFSSGQVTGSTNSYAICYICRLIWDDATAGAPFASLKSHLINTHGFTDSG